MSWCPVHAVDNPGQACPECMEAGREVVALRTATQKHFALPDGRMMAQVSRVGPVHYRDGDEWVDLAPNWVRFEGGWKLEGMPFGVEVRDGEVAMTITGDGETCHARMIDGPKVEAVGVGNRLFWETPDLSMYLLVHRTGISTHYQLLTPDAPRTFRWVCEGPHPWSSPVGRDNINREPVRREVEMTRLLNLESTLTNEGITVRWDGRVKALDKHRRRRLTDDVIYPVRIKH